MSEPARDAAPGRLNLKSASHSCNDVPKRKKNVFFRVG